MAYFPVIEKATGVEGLSEGNMEQHDAFLGGLKDFDDYIYNVSASQYSGQRVREILDSFAATLQSHLTDEVVWIMALSRFKNLDLASIDNFHRDYVKSRQSQTRIVPFLLTNHDILYEAGIHSGWPFMAGALAEQDEAPGMSAKLRNLWLRYVCTLVHRGAWKYSSCTFAGKPKPLIKAQPRPRRLAEEDVELGANSEDSLF